MLTRARAILRKASGLRQCNCRAVRVVTEGSRFTKSERKTYDGYRSSQREDQFMTTLAESVAEIKKPWHWIAAGGGILLIWAAIALPSLHRSMPDRVPQTAVCATGSDLLRRGADEGHARRSKRRGRPCRGASE
jgi:hypothetical protein